MDRRLLIVGAGGHGVVVAEAAEAMGRWSSIVFADDVYPEIKSVLDWPVIASSDVTEALVDAADDVCIAIGDNSTRLAKQGTFSATGLGLASIVHPGAHVSSRAILGVGSVVLAGAVINARAKLGDACIVNTGATVDHDCVLGNGVHISPGAHLAGLVRVGECSWIGLGALVRGQIEIEDNAIVGAGAVVVNNVGSRLRVVGNPARLLAR